MTREEAIKILVRAQRGLIATALSEYEHKMIDALEMALSALRGPTREQVEKVRGKFFQAGIDDVAQDTWRCSRCLVQEFGNIQGINFCPSCGAPMTDKAVDMVMERLEEVQKNEG